MWQLLYNSLNDIKVIDLLNVAQAIAVGIIEQIDVDNQELKKRLPDLVKTQHLNKGDEIQRIYAIMDEEKLTGILYGDHVLNLKMQPFYTELIQKTAIIKSSDDLFNTTVQRIITRIIKHKNSIISPKEFDILSSFSSVVSNMQFMENTYCIDSADFSELRLHQLCETRYFKKIKNEYSHKWNTIVAMKDFRVTKLYYKKYLLAGFALYRKEDGEQFFWSGQFQEVLESLIN